MHHAYKTRDLKVTQAYPLNLFLLKVVVGQQIRDIVQFVGTKAKKVLLSYLPSSLSNCRRKF